MILLIPLPDIPLSKLAKDGIAESVLPTIVVCRRGNDSLTAARLLQEAGHDARDVVGGLRAWSEQVDRKFPVY